jgi:hypothetical protein
MKQLCEAIMSLAVEETLQIPASGLDDIPPTNLFEPLVMVTVVPGDPEDTLRERSGIGLTVKEIV